jgi:kinesin family member 6/9
LAGSERLAKTQSQGITQKEAQYINKSLSFLEQVVIGLTDKKSFVQFRQSKLTHLLKDSIGGNCLTSMISNIWPELRHMEETISTLRFSSRMMNVTVEPAVNEIIDPMRMMQKLDNEVKMLRQELSMHDTLANRRVQSYEPLSEHQLLEIENQCRRFIEGSIEDIEVVNLRQVQHIFKSFKRICKQIDKDVEAKLREKFALIDKSDADQIAEAQKAGLTIDDNLLVGDTDGQNFGIGVANKDSRASKSDLSKVSKKTRAKHSDAKSSTKTSSPLLDPKSGKNKQNTGDPKDNRQQSSPTNQSGSY